MKDPRSILREKEQDLERVRREIQALLTVIPLLVDDPPTSDVVHEVLLASSRAPVNLPDNDMAQLEIYYPFVRHLRLAVSCIDSKDLSGFVSQNLIFQASSSTEPPASNLRLQPGGPAGPPERELLYTSHASDESYIARSFRSRW